MANRLMNSSKNIPELTNQILQSNIVKHLDVSNESNQKEDITKSKKLELDANVPVQAKYTRGQFNNKIKLNFLDLKEWGKYHSVIQEQNFTSYNNNNLGVLMKVSQMKKKLLGMFKSDQIKDNAVKRSRFYDIDFKKQPQLKKNMKMMAKLVINFLRVLKKIRVRFSDLGKWPVFPTEAYMIPGSKEFFMYIKVGNYKAVKQILQQNRFFIFQIDSVSFKPLHKVLFTNKTQG